MAVNEVSAFSGSISIPGTITLGPGSANVGTVAVSGTIPVSGSFTLTPSGTQTVAGTVTAVQATGTNLHTVVDAGTLALVSAIGGTVTVAGTVATSGGAAITPVVSSSLEAGHVLKGSAGTLNYLEVTNGSTVSGWACVTNATTAATSGAIAPFAVRALPPLGSVTISPPNPMTFSTGISVVLTNNASPFVATTGTLTGFIGGLVV